MTAAVVLVALLAGFLVGRSTKQHAKFDAGVLAGRLLTENAHGWPHPDPVVKAKRRAWLVDRKVPADPFVHRDMTLFRATDHVPPLPRQR